MQPGHGRRTGSPVLHQQRVRDVCGLEQRRDRRPGQIRAHVQDPARPVDGGRWRRHVRGEDHHSRQLGNYRVLLFLPHPLWYVWQDRGCGRSDPDGAGRCEHAPDSFRPCDLLPGCGRLRHGVRHLRHPYLFRRRSRQVLPSRQLSVRAQERRVQQVHESARLQDELRDARAREREPARDLHEADDPASPERCQHGQSHHEARHRKHGVQRRHQGLVGRHHGYAEHADPDHASVARDSRTQDHGGEDLLPRTSNC
mmetsp:Transcript_28401/g.45471  ORF Transcript_28401/g.45471 Transcript_28401/m.45471 type:complete len:255 (-) Transcript_28401:816-1580(-)